MKVTQYEKFECEDYEINIPHCEVYDDEGKLVESYVSKRWFADKHFYLDELKHKKQVAPNALNLALYLSVIQPTPLDQWVKLFGGEVFNVACELVKANLLVVKKYPEAKPIKEEPKEEKAKEETKE